LNLTELIKDPSTPRWALNLIAQLDKLDIVDVLNVLESLQISLIAEYAENISVAAREVRLEHLAENKGPEYRL